MLFPRLYWDIHKLSKTTLNPTPPQRVFNSPTKKNVFRPRKYQSYRLTQPDDPLGIRVASVIGFFVCSLFS